VRDPTDLHGADLPPLRVLRHLPAERLADELVAEADAEERRAPRGDLPDQVLGAEHPGRALRDAAARPRDDEAVRVLRARQRRAHVAHVALLPGARPDRLGL